MNTTVDIIDNPFDVHSKRTVGGENVISVLQEQWDTFPETAHLYAGYVSNETDVTPSSQQDVEALQKAPGHYIVVIYPGAAIPMLVWYVAAALAVSVLAMVVLKPKVPNAASRNVQSESSNNSLANRTNESRPKARIPDIFGTVRAYPDLVQLPYSHWVDNQQVESTLMCLGRGEYDVRDVKESDTAVSEVPGTAISLWRPGKDIEVDAPDAIYGPAAHGEDPVWDRFGAAIVRRSNSVDGVTLEPGNSSSFSGQFRYYPDGMVMTPQGLFRINKGLDFTQLFQVGDDVKVQIVNPGATSINTYIQLVRPQLTFAARIVGHLLISAGDQLEFTPASFIVNDTSRDFSGRYTVTSATMDFENNVTTVFLDSPENVNPSWYYITGENSSQMQTADVSYGTFDADYSFLRGTYKALEVGKLQVKLDVGDLWNTLPSIGSPIIQSTIMGVNATDDGGPFTVSGSQGVRAIMFNFYAGQGMFKDDGKNQTATSVVIGVSIFAYDKLNVQIGQELTASATVQGSATDQRSKGATLMVNVPEASYYRVKASRTTPKDTAFEGQVVDEVKWRDLYSVSPVNLSTFGNVTMLRVTSRANDTALTGKDRKLNMEVTRRIKVREAGGEFSADLRPTNYIGDILHHVMVDPYIGNRQEYEIDTRQIYETLDTARGYFGFDEILHFCYTFDKTGMSFEETVQLIADAGLLTAYRQGSIIRLALEYRDAPAKLLFNHRNKMPGSEKRSYQFARENNYDGVQFSYVSPEDDSLQTLYIPNESPINPRKIESVGIRNERQALVHAWREQNKILYRNTILEFEGLAESESVIPPHNILVADNTRSSTIDGYVVSQSGLVLRLSQVATFDPAKLYSIILQMGDGSIETIQITPQEVETDMVTLANAPNRPIITDLDYVQQTLFYIVANGDVNVRRYILTERDAGDSTANTYPMVAINYDPRYYANDKDFAPSETDEWLNGLGDMILWLDASINTSISLAEGGMSQWRDSSKAGNDATQAVVDLRTNVNSTIFNPQAVTFFE